jgi:hypothetical protein
MSASEGNEADEDKLQALLWRLELCCFISRELQASAATWSAPAPAPALALARQRHKRRR